MKIWMVSDTHFGIRPTMVETWLKMASGYFYDFYIPMLRRHAKPGDVLIHLGDVFDNRNSINVKVLDEVVRVFNDLGNILPVYVLVGNHDSYGMADTQVNSTAAIRHVPNVVLVDRPTELEFGGKTALLLPWVHGKQSELDLLLKYSGKDLLFCHSDLVGARTQVNPTRPINRHVCAIEDFEGYGRVYSGHIHIRQKIKNFTFVGAPYHMDRNDLGNTKGVYVLDTVKDKDGFVPNTHSPEFKLVEIHEEADLEKLTADMLDKDYVDLQVINSLLVDKPSVRTKLDRILSAHSIASIKWLDDSKTAADAPEDASVSLDDLASGDLDHLSMCRLWLSNQRMSEDAAVNDGLYQDALGLLEEAERIRKATVG